MLFLLFLAFAMTACSPFGNVSVVEIKAPDLSFDNTSFDYGSLNLGSSTTAIFTITNHGNTTATGCGSIALSDTTNFSVVTNNCNTSSMAVGAQCEVEIASHPMTVGVKNLTITRACSSNVTVSTATDQIVATGVTASLAWTPLTNNFGAVYMGTQSGSQVFTLTNNGVGSASGCSSPTLTDSTNFSITANTCGTSNLASSGTCTVSVRANPATVGNKSTTLSRSCTVGGIVTTTSNQIRVTSQSAIQAWSPLTHNFGSVNVGDDSATHIITLTNTGTAAATGCSAPTITNGANFFIIADTCAGSDLAPGGNCKIDIRGTPISAGTKYATVSRVCSQGGTIFTTANGITMLGVNPIAPSLAWDILTHDFGEVQVGDVSSSQVFTLTNSGSGDAQTCELSTLSDTANFTIIADTCTLNDPDPLLSMSSCEITILANPISSGLKSTTLSRTCNIGGTVTTTADQITVTGTLLQNLDFREKFMSRARVHHTATLMPDGKVLVVGGNENQSTLGTLNRTEHFNPSTGIWSTLANTNTKRQNHAANLLDDGKILISGGFDSFFGPLAMFNTTEVYDAVNDIWVLKTPMNVARSGHSSIKLQDGQILVVGGYGSGGTLNSVELYNPVNNTWTVRAPMSVNRSIPELVLLSDGRVMAIGGSLSGFPYYSNSVEIYDPINNTWFNLTPLNAGRYEHTVVLLPNDDVLVTGGTSSSGILNTAELYNLTNNTWTYTANMSDSRREHAISLLQDGRVVVIGGQKSGQILNTVEAYDYQNDVWTNLATLNEGRFGHTATLLLDGRILIAGGYNNSQLNSSEVYDFNSDDWIVPDQVAKKTRGHTATVLQNNKVLIVGGIGENNTELYSSSTNTWETKSALPTQRYFHTASLLQNGDVLVVGGANGLGPLNSVYRYNLDNNTWTAKAPLSGVRYYHTAVVLQNGKVLVVGGTNNSSTLMTAELYDPANDSWSTVTSMSDPRAYHTMTLLNDGRVLVVGGSTSYEDFEPLDTAEIYDPGLNSWTSTPSLSSEYQHHTATLLQNGFVFITSGNSYSGLVTQAEVYDPINDVWTIKASIPTPRYLATATLLQDGKVLIVGGQDSLDISGAVDLYDPQSDTWQTRPHLIDGRYEHTSTLLNNGKVLVHAGRSVVGLTWFWELID